VTYPETAVAATVSERFIPCQLNVLVEENKAVLDRYHQAWTPDIRILSPEGDELYSWQGYLPPFEFLPQMLAGEGRAKLRLGELERSASVYEEILRRFPTCSVAPESQYFLAVARYKASHDRADLIGTWQRLQSRYPTSIWRQKQQFTEST
jgi:tetratricopeptide (TPR) repeat protein